MKDIKYIIADNVRIYRKKRNLTQLELAERADLSVDSIKRVERGCRTISLENFMRIAEALEIEVIYLLSDGFNDSSMSKHIQKLLINKNERQQKYLLHMLGEMA